MSAERLPFDELFLKEKLKSDPTTWETRRQLAHGLYDKQAYEEAAEIIWTTDQIPSTDLDLAFAIRILAKAQPRRAIRLLTAVLELNQGKAVQNMAMANALLHHGMVLQAARFYGAALEADPTLVNPDLEHFVLWSDDECTMWDLFDKHHPKLGQLPWMLRDPKEALRLTSRISLHTTPISVPELPTVHGEDIKHDLYQQEAKYQAKITPPPAVTIPIDRVDPKHRLYDADYGATVVDSTAAAADEPAAYVDPIESAAEPAAEPAAQPAATPTLLPAAVSPESNETLETAESSSSFPAKVMFPDSSKPVVPVAPTAPVAPASSVEPAEPVESFPAKVMFPDSSKPVVPFAASSEPATLPDLVPSPPLAVSPFQAAPSEEANDSASGTSKNKNIIPQAFPVSESSVPTRVLHVKWSTSHAKPGDAPATPPVARPIAPPVPIVPPVAPPAPTPVPSATLMPSESPDETQSYAPAPPTPPAPAPFTVAAQDDSAPTPAAPTDGAPTGPATRPLIPIAPPATAVPVPTGVPTRVLLPSGTPPANGGASTGVPTRRLLPSGAPPENAGAPRRLLLTPSRPVPPQENNEG